MILSRLAKLLLILSEVIPTFNIVMNLEKYSEILQLPIIITKLDLEMEKSYLEYYDDEYWENYVERKIKKLSNRDE